MSIYISKVCLYKYNMKNIFLLNTYKYLIAPCGSKYL